MRTFLDWPKPGLERPSLVTIGAFDGLHVGHQELLHGLTSRAHQMGWLATVVTFDPLPKVVLNPGIGLPCLTTVEEKARLLSEWGLDVLVVLPFTRDMAAMPAERFTHMLIDHLQMAELWVGWDFALGRDRSGNAQALRQMGQQMGFNVRVLSPVVRSGEAVSSTRIRNALALGQVEQVAEMLGRLYRFKATPMSDGNGSQQDPSVMRLEPQPVCAIPGAGAYLGHVIIGANRHPALLVIGNAPEKTIQAHLLASAPARQAATVEIEFTARVADSLAPGSLEGAIATAKGVLACMSRMKK